MNEFFVNIWDSIGLLVWSDWLTIAILLSFLMTGFKRGMAKELINLAFLLLSILLAWLFYQPLSTSPAITWVLLSQQSQMAIAFGIIFIGVLFLKKALCRLTESSSTINNPCALNKILALGIFLIAAIALSWCYLDIVSNLEIMEITITDESLRIGVSFVVILLIIIGICSLLFKILNISIDSSKPCLLEAFFKKILGGMQAVDTIINARNVNSTKNNLLGAAIGIIKGSLAILIMVIILQSVSWVSQQYYWVETKGALRTFQDIATDIKPELSQHLLFIEAE